MDEPGDGRFAEDCGLVNPLRLDVGGLQGADAGPRTFAGPSILIGRDERADLRLVHTLVSRRHAYLQVIAGRVFWLDLKSRSGVRTGEHPGRRGWLDAGREILIGPATIRLASASGGPLGEGGTAVDASPEPRRRPATPQRGLLEFADREDGTIPWQINRTLVLVGRDGECHVRLPGAEVSGFHCALLRTPGGTWAVDLLSRTGTLINGEPIRRGRLADGDELRIGPHRIRYRPATALEDGPESPPRPARYPLVTRSPAASGSLAGPASGWTLGEPAPGQAAITEATMGLMVDQFGRMQQQMCDQFQQLLMLMAQMFGTLQRDQIALIREELDRLRLPPPELPASRADPALAPPQNGSSPPRPGGSRPSADASPRPEGAPDSDEFHAILCERIAEMQRERQGGFRKILDLMGRRTAP